MEKKTHLDRKLARLAAVQAAFQSHQRKQPLLTVMKEFQTQSFAMVLDDTTPDVLSGAFFEELLTGLNEKQDQINEIIVAHLTEGWSFERIDSVSRALLQVGLCELLFHPETPAIVVVHEYTNMAHAFFDEKDAGFINGLLNTVARSVRPHEFEA